MNTTNGPKARTTQTTIEGSPEAKRTAAVLLEVLTGLRTTPEACETLGISLMKYYALETRALQGMVTSLEPRPKGRRRSSPEEVVKTLIVERDRLGREVRRSQALLRLVRKSYRMKPPENTAKKKGKRRRKVKARGERALARLAVPPDSSEESA